MILTDHTITLSESKLDQRQTDEQIEHLLKSCKDIEEKKGQLIKQINNNHTTMQQTMITQKHTSRGVYSSMTFD